jgi:hypothetical protein
MAAKDEKMVIDPNTADMVPASSLDKKSQDIEKPSSKTFDMAAKVNDSIGFIQQFAMKQELKTENLI